MLTAPVMAFAKNTVAQKYLRYEYLKNTDTQKKLPEIECIQNAIEKRDDSILSAIDKRYESQKSALVTRKTDLIAAWNIGNQKNRRTAIKNAWQKYSAAIQKSRKGYDASRLNAWKQFYTDRKACGKNAISDDRTTEGIDNNL